MSATVTLSRPFSSVLTGHLFRRAPHFGYELAGGLGTACADVRDDVPAVRVVHRLRWRAFALYIGGGLWLFALLFASFSLVQYYFSDTLTLKSMGAKTVSADEYPQLHASIERLSQQADLPNRR